MSEENQPINLQNKFWYVVTTYSTHENKVAENIKKRAVSYNLEDQIFRVIVAEETIENKENPEKSKTINLYPGYIYVEMVMTEQSWYVVRNTEGVTGIIGSSGGGTKPTPVPASEMESVLKRIGLVDDSMLLDYHLGDRVKIIDGPFADQEGVIVGINEQTKDIEIEISFFGQKSKLVIPFANVDRIS